MRGAGASDGTSDQVWFISHAGADRAWAEWIAWQLLDAGLQVELDYWDWGGGDNFILKMNAALERGWLLALFSPAYFELERFTTPEWTAMMAMQGKIGHLRAGDRRGRACSARCGRSWASPERPAPTAAMRSDVSCLVRWWPHAWSGACVAGSRSGMSVAP
ncbi:hypothetical protein QF037_000446 [Streptomyces canus]|uniref:toll/interleukin-1 receptor domain-containing protein n=1 Tax=Streptomyces canus TaxID=58343 RepID=UPI00278AF2DF|nr:hypothetical protein [Streptomyces canus]